MPDVVEKSKNSEKSKARERLENKLASFRKKLNKIQPSWFENLKEPKWLRWGLIVGTALFAAFIMAPNPVPTWSLALGEPAQETITSPLTFRVIDEAATNKNRDEVLKSVLPVYDFDDEMVRDVQERIIAAFSFMRDYLIKEAEYRERGTVKLQEKNSSGKGKKSSAEAPFRPLDEKTLRIRFENLLGANVSPSSFSILKSTGFHPRIERDLRSLVVPVLVKGVVSSRELLMRDGKKGILLWSKSKAKLEPLKDLSKIFDLGEAINFINVEEKRSTRDPALSKVVRRLARDLINFNITYNRERSDGVKRDALASWKKVYFQVAKGEPIIKKGEPVNEGHLRKLAGLKMANPPYSRYMILAGFALALILVLRLSFYFAEKHLDRSKQASHDLLLICLLMLGTIILLRFVASLTPLMSSFEKGMTSRSLLYAAPVATGSMLTALMVDARMAFIFAALTALLSSLAVEGDIYLFFFYFVSGVVGLHGMTRITDRTSIMRAGLVVGLVNMVSILALKMALGQLTGIEEMYDIGLGFVGGVISGILVSGLAPLLEPLGYTTNVKLLEIANLNHPLLQEMAMTAPGTYHHSIMVGNLAESASAKIGANSLLSLVGAYYHDIGKIGTKAKHSYFIENQERGVNPHDKLEPSMSALILVSHVKHGVEKARESRLGAPIVDIIQQHHGTNLIKFFYNKALEKNGDNPKAVPDDKYRYPGPRPQTKEAAVVMLADVAEAACRTLTEPTPSRIQKRVQTLIMGLFNDGQLDESSLTLKDLHAVTKSFTHSLQGILHSRIVYPLETEFQEKANGDNAKQQTEKDRNRVDGPQEQGRKDFGRLGM